MSDESARRQALNVDQSFLVQAPAGSGKTELLTQRFLALLARVADPEQVVAITFTRKAAAEMRNRILKALHLAQGPRPEESYRQCTYDLAKKVLIRNTKADWKLLENPNRLRILTIDGLCHLLINRMPVVSQMGVSASVSDDVGPLYEKTVDQWIARHLGAEVLPPDWQVVLSHFDNRLDVLKRLMTGLLGSRDQWLPYVTHGLSDDALRARLEQGLQNVQADVVEALEATIPDDVKQAAPLFQTLCDRLGIPFSTFESLADYQTLASLFLTQKEALRKTFTAKQGLMASADAKTPEDKASLKESKAQLQRCRDAIEETPRFLNALIQSRGVPPAHYDAAQWAFLSSLMKLLPELAAEFMIVCREQGTLDHSLVAQYALASLSDDDGPTDLQLSMDYAIHHLLIDEFQDTSWTQFQLTQRLVSHWDQHPERTLFLVGDPMQSIYRFRGAEVGLFLKAKAEGIGPVSLSFLQLTRNFRSSHQLLAQWNTIFHHLFPKVPDLSRGAIPYAPGIATQEEAGGCAYQQLTSPEAFVEQLRVHHQTYPEHQVAVLVRSRRHFFLMKPALDAAELGYQAYDMTRFSDSPWLQDILSLIAATTHWHDRFAWARLLRAPYIGFCLEDLDALMGLTEPASVWACLQRPETRPSLSDDALSRWDKIRPILEHWLLHKGRRQYSQWLRGLWEALGAQQWVPESVQSTDIDTVFETIERFSTAHVIEDFPRLEEALENLFLAPPERRANTWLTVMTIHKSKGLEFDAVFVPSIESASAVNDTPLLSWLERPRQDSVDWLLAPYTPFDESPSPIHQYVRQEEKRRAQLEDARLLYVACTRAKSHLTWVSFRPEDSKVKKGSFEDMLAFSLPAYAQPAANCPEPTITTDENLGEPGTPLYRRAVSPAVKAGSYPNRYVDEENAILQSEGFGMESESQREARWLGTLIHLVYEYRMRGIPEYAIGIDSLLDHFPFRLAYRRQYAQTIQEALAVLSSCPKGQWLLQPHSDKRVEWALPSRQGLLRLDLSFECEGTRWIVDYKTTESVHADRSSYQDQLNHYADVLSRWVKQPIRCALYYPLAEEKWFEWVPSDAAKRHSLA